MQKKQSKRTEASHWIGYDLFSLIGVSSPSAGRWHEKREHLLDTTHALVESVAILTRRQKLGTKITRWNF